MKKKHALLFLALSFFCRIGATPADVLAKIGSPNGIVAVLNDPSSALTVSLVQISNLIVYQHLSASDNLARAQFLADSLGYLGTRIYVEKDRDGKLPFGNEFLDAVASETSLSIAQNEIMRVLRPGAKAIIAGMETVKQALPGMDPWTQPHYGPDNSLYSRDTIIKPPYLTKFMVEPRYGPYPQAVAAAGSRIFRAFGHIDPHSPQNDALLNRLVAFNAFNGTRLWSRPLTTGIMVDRNTMIATPDTLFIGDTLSCLYINAATGALMDQFTPAVAGGTFWKWMGRENGIIVAVVGAKEQMDPDTKSTQSGGWGWPQLSAGYTQSTNPWGFGKTVIAFNPGTKQLLWTHTESVNMDCRAVCMKNGRVFIFNWSSYLACLNASTGAEIWRKTPSNAPEIFGSIGTYSESQSEGLAGWRTIPYLKCNSNAVYIANTRNNDGSIVAVNAATGAKLWSGIEGRSRLVVGEAEVYAVSSYSNKLSALTGASLFRGSADNYAGCTAITGCAEGVYTRGAVGTTRVDVRTFTQQGFFPFRPDCLTGVTISNGQLYWWPWNCSCGYNFFGTISVANARGFVHEQAAVEGERLEKAAGDILAVSPLAETANDWPSFRRDNTGGAASEAVVNTIANLMWKFTPRASSVKSTAPTAAGGLAFFGGSDGAVVAYDINTGSMKWKAYTGGVIRYPPTVRLGRVFVGSGDGWAYCFEAATGRQLWRFRGAPDSRKCQMFGSLLSNWPAATGVLAKDSVVYFACGITPYDGTHLYALKAADGSIVWQNNTSGRKVPGDAGGVAVQGQMLIYNNTLYLAGGNMCSPAAYDLSNGTWLTGLSGGGSVSEELYLYNGTVYGSGNRFYRDMNGSAGGGRKTFMTENSAKTLFCVLEPVGNEAVMVFNNGTVSPLPAWQTIPTQAPLWRINSSYGMIKGATLHQNAAVILRTSPHNVSAYNVTTGAVLWSKALASEALPWGLAVDAAGRVLVTLQNGEVHCYGSGPSAIEDQPKRLAPGVFSLDQNYPNPFHAGTRIRYSLARETDVSITISDIRGRLVRTLVSGRMSAGAYTLPWDGRDAHGRAAGCGLYQCRLATREFVKNLNLFVVK